MADIAGVPAEDVVELQSVRWIDDCRVLRVHGACQRCNACRTAGAECFGRMTCRAKHGFVQVRGAIIQALRGIAHRCQSSRVVLVRRVLLVVKAQDIEAEIALVVWVIHPTGCWHGRSAGAGLVAGTAIHLIAHGHHDVGTREHRVAGVLHGDAHEGIRVLAACIVRRADGNPSGLEPVHAGHPSHRLRCVRGTRHRLASQSLIHGDVGTEERGGVVVEVRLAKRGRIDRAIRIGHAFIGHGDARSGWIGDEVPRGVHDVRVDGVEGRQDGEDAVVVVHAMHTEIVPRHDGPLAVASEGE